LEDFRKKILHVLSLVLLVVAFGTAGYMVIEGWNFLDALYMTLTTITTVGFREVHEL
jgi:voltage-gated potassium channel